ncbi:MAG: hypothetical protein JXB00_13985 [Bacteroidales bacterium]|nr:hypothetical protein [Bacteroidales bacterium]
MEEKTILITKILEHQRNIIMLKQFIRELEKDGSDTSRMKKEIAELERKINELQVKCEMVY